MVRIAADHPMFRDPTLDVLGPRVNFRGTTANVDGATIKNEVIKDRTVSETVGDAVRAPGLPTPPAGLERTNLATVGIGSDTLFEIQTGMERLDSGELPPLERSPVHARIHHNKTVGTEAEDTGQTPVKISVGFGFDPKRVDAAKTRGVLIPLVANEIPASYILPRTSAVPRGSLERATIDVLI